MLFRSLLLAALQKFLFGLGVEKLFAVRHAAQVSGRKHLLPNPWRKIFFDYDAFWKECGGKLTDDGWFELPRLTIRRPLPSVDARKRALYLRRYAFLDDLAQQLHSSLASHRT